MSADYKTYHTIQIADTFVYSSSTRLLRTRDIHHRVHNRETDIHIIVFPAVVGVRGSE